MKKRVISSVGVPIKFINVVMISMFLIDISSIDSNLFLFLPQKLKKQHSEWDEIEERRDWLYLEVSILQLISIKSSPFQLNSKIFFFSYIICSKVGYIHFLYWYIVKLVWKLRWKRNSCNKIVLLLNRNRFVIFCNIVNITYWKLDCTEPILKKKIKKKIRN